MKNLQKLMRLVSEKEKLKRDKLKASKGLIRYVHDPFLLGTKKRGKLIFTNKKLIVVPYSFVWGFKESSEKWLNIFRRDINDMEKMKDWITLNFGNPSKNLKIRYSSEGNHTLTIKGIKDESIEKIKNWKKTGKI